MISWSTIAYGAALSALLAAILVAVAARGQRRPAVVLGAAAAAAAGAVPGRSSPVGRPPPHRRNGHNRPLNSVNAVRVLPHRIHAWCQLWALAISAAVARGSGL